MGNQEENKTNHNGNRLHTNILVHFLVALTVNKFQYLHKHIYTIGNLKSIPNKVPAFIQLFPCHHNVDIPPIKQLSS